jgi:hypothetical protein
MYLKPAPGLRIVDPLLRDFLPDDGRCVEPSDYWHRRLRDGDVVPAPNPAEAQAEALAQPAAVRKGADQ